MCCTVSNTLYKSGGISLMSFPLASKVSSFMKYSSNSWDTRAWTSGIEVFDTSKRTSLFLACKDVFPTISEIQEINSLTNYQTTNFKLFQTERVCRRQFQIRRKWHKVIQRGRKHCGKMRNCSLQAISPFHTVFPKGFFPRGIKRCHCVGMG